MSKFSFFGKHILITGAGGGLGSALSRALVELGARLVLSDRSLENIAELKSTLPEDAAIIPIPADLSVPGEAENLALKTIDVLGHIDVLINNAGVGYHALMQETTEDRLRTVYEVNTFSPLALVKSLLPSMQRRESGMVINVLSCAGFIPIPTAGVYSASKAAFSTMARAMRLELEPAGVKVFNFYPGPINTSFNENAFRENERLGLHACGTAGTQPEIIAQKILLEATGRPGDIWLDRRSKWLALIGTIWPKLSDRRLLPLRDAALLHRTGQPPPVQRRWRLWQLETSIACNLDCIMCPWKEERRQNFKTGDMTAETWAALRPYLPETRSIDFSGGGEPLLQPRLMEWLQEASAAGCETGFLTNGIILNREMSRRFIQAGLDWIGFSIDGATAEIYEKIRKGADFRKLCENISALSGMRGEKNPFIMINFVLMPENIHQLEEIVKLAARLGVDQVNFKQCDVVRGEHGKGHGLFASKEDRSIRRLKKALGKARRLANRLDIKTTAFKFVPDELPVCDQDPRNSLFVGHDGRVAPCINLTNGGPSFFLGKEVTIPSVHYGRLSDRDLMELWETSTCRFYRTRFEKREQAYNAVIADSSIESSLIKLKETLSAAREAMPQAPEGCEICHYLYDI